MQGAIEDGLATFSRAPVDLVVAGRTDAGVHAWGQVFSTDLPDGVDLGRAKQAVNSLAGPAIAVRELEQADQDFSARYQAASRTYVYRLATADWLDPFRYRYVWWVKRQLDVDAMQTAIETFIGEHDFAAFCKVGAAGGTVRHILDAHVEDVGTQCVDVWMRGVSFGHQMVRSIVGLLEAIGHGRRPPKDAALVLAGRDRSANSCVAPPHGLCLWSVEYPGA